MVVEPLLLVELPVDNTEEPLEYEVLAPLVISISPPEAPRLCPAVIAISLPTDPDPPRTWICPD